MKGIFFIFILSGLFLFQGCSFFATSYDKKHYYQLYYNPKKQIRSHFKFTVRVKTFEIDKVYRRYNLVYRKSPFELFYYKTHFWAARPEDVVTDTILNHIEKSNIFNDVILRLSKKPDFVITGKVVALDEFDSKDKWYARIAILYLFKDFKSGKVLVSYFCDDRSEVLLKKPVFVVRTMSDLLEKNTNVFLDKVEKYLLSNEKN
jgi:uncharacterized lipoprotein YmbA